MNEQLSFIISSLKESKDNVDSQYNKNIENIQKSLLTLSTAGMGFSISLLSNLSNSKNILLYISWIMFALAIMFILVSFLFKTKSLINEFIFYRDFYYDIVMKNRNDNYNNIITETYKKIRKNSSISSFFLYAGMLSFFLAIFFTLIFAINL